MQNVYSHAVQFQDCFYFSNIGISQLMLIIPPGEGKIPEVLSSVPRAQAGAARPALKTRPCAQNAARQGETLLRGSCKKALSWKPSPPC